MQNYSKQIKVCNFFTEPISTLEIIENLFLEALPKVKPVKDIITMSYDLFTAYSYLFTPSGSHYMKDKETAFQSLADYVRNAKLSGP